MILPRIVVVGSLNMDIVIEAERAPQTGETILGKSVQYLPGGKGANQAVATSRLGANTVMIGAVGDDLFGKELLETLDNEKIVTDTIKVVNERSSGVASILLTLSRDNSIIVIPGANQFCCSEDIDLHEKYIADADLVLIQLEIPLSTAIYAVEKAKHYGKTVILNPAPAMKLPADLLNKIDYITPNESELGIISGIETKSGQLEKAVDQLLEMGVSNVITTLGSNGIAYKRKGGAMERIPSHKVNVEDTTGAGDAFNAGLAFALIKEKDLPRAINFANKVAALSVTKKGAQLGMPSLKEVLEFQTDSIEEGGS